MTLMLLLTPAANAAGVSALRPRAQPEVPVTSTDLALTAANNSPALVADPTDRRFVVAAHRMDAPDFSCGLQLSGDGGLGWIGADPVPVLPEGAEKCYAPEVAFDRGGTLYYLFVGLQGNGNAPMGAFIATSSNQGSSFSPPRMVLGPENYQVRMVVDPAIGEIGRLYLVWLHSSVSPPLGGLPSSQNPILATYSDDGGQTFSTPVTVSDADRPLSVAPNVAIGADHALHVAYYDLQDDRRDYQGLEGPVWDGTWSVVVATSTDRGDHFGPGSVVAEGIVPPGRVILIYTMPAPAFAADGRGNLYAAWPDAREGGADVFLARSTDGGRSWAAPTRLNDEPPGAGATQELPRLGVATNGRVDAVFLDRRNDPDDRRNDVYYTFSADRGLTFSPNLRLTSEGSDSKIGQRYQIPSAAGLVERGSRLAVLSRPDAVLVAWPDTRHSTFGTNQQDVFAAEVRFAGDGGGIGPAVPVAGVVAVGLAAIVAARARGTRRTRRVA